MLLINLNLLTIILTTMFKSTSINEPPVGVHNLNFFYFYFYFSFDFFKNKNNKIKN